MAVVTAVAIPLAIPGPAGCENTRRSLRYIANHVHSAATVTRIRLPGPALAVVLACAGAAYASDEPERRLLRHEYVDPVMLRALDATQAVESSLAYAAGESSMPEAIERDGARLDAPPSAFGEDAPTFADDGGQRRDDRAEDRDASQNTNEIARPNRMRPDRDTGPDGHLTYHAVFNPSVAPLRRNVAFDAVDDDYEFSIRDRSEAGLRLVPLSPQRVTSGRELFWGDVAIDAIAGRAHPIPSVAPDMRILAVEAAPAVDSAFLKDSADNFYVRAVGYTGELRIVFLVDADSRYFSAAVPDTVRLDVNAAHPAAQVPARARRAAKEVAAILGVGPDVPFARGVDRLVAWFRDFDAGETPPNSGDIYRDLALGGVGVCRHRSFGFAVTARAVGLPTRYVQNEAHAFVEILAPDGVWRRIDLGGEAPSLDIVGGEGRRLHQAPPDPYPKPERYVGDYSSRLVRGDAGDDRAVPQERAVPDGARDSEIATSLAGVPSPMPRLGGAASGGVPGRAAAREPSPAARPGGADGDVPAVTDGPDAGLSIAPVPGPAASLLTPTADGPGRPVSIHLEVQVDEVEAFRGERLPFEVSGTLRAADGSAEAVVGVAIQLYMVPEDGAGAGVPVGPRLTSDTAGRFSTLVTLPQTLGLGRYRLVVASGETSGWSAGRSSP